MEEVLSRVGELVSGFFGSLAQSVERVVTGLFGSANARLLRKLQPLVAAVNGLESRYQAMTDAELREQTAKFRKRLASGETLDDLLIEAFAVCREAGRRVLGMRHYDVQLLGGMVLHRGAIAEMVTGEGKTLVATLPAYLNALEGKGVHVVTVNDYLARRDMEWMGPLYMSLGLTVGAIQADMEAGARQRAYECDITYGTNNEFGFDYLRDNMRPARKGDKRYPKNLQQVQSRLHYAIIDEVDNILIDEARTPLIIAGPAHDDVSRYLEADRIARQLRKGVHFEVNEKDHSCHLNDEGVRAAERLAGVESFYTAGHMEWPHLIDNSLKAHHLYKRDVNYIVDAKGEVVIVDEFTGRLMPGRHWSDGLHQAVEAKEGVKIKEENQTLATITLQNFFKLYDKICGMTGTAMTEAGEFWKIYKLDVVAIPTNRQLKRVNHPDVVFRTEREKYQAIVDEIERMNKWDVLVNPKGEEYLGRIVREDDRVVEFRGRDEQTVDVIEKSKIKEIQRRGRPILVGTVSIERSELLSRMLEARGVEHQVLNAKYHQREAEIIAQAGRKGAVTIATNMAGRGTDIILGGNPEAMAWALLQNKYPTRLEVPQDEWDRLVQEIEQREQMKAEGREVAAMGGLHIIGSERHEARRIDLQLRGRCGRQGDPGSSRFYLSLEDDLMRIFAGEWVKNMLTRLGMKEGEAIVSRMVSRRIEGAQRKVEERNFDIRKNLLEYDEVMDEQRKRVYGYRQRVLEGAGCKGLIREMVQRQVEHHIGQFLQPDFGTASFAEWAGKQLAVEIDARELRGMDYEAAAEYVLGQADREIETLVFEAIEENLPEDAEPGDWNWEALTKWANTRWRLKLRERELKECGRENVAEKLIEAARAAVAQVDLSEGRRFLEPDFGLSMACVWARSKFGVELTPAELAGMEPEAVRQQISRLADEVYEQREIEYPVSAAMRHFSGIDAAGLKRLDREGLAAWAAKRFNAAADAEQFKNLQREEIRAALVEMSRQFAAGLRAAQDEAAERLGELTGSEEGVAELSRADRDYRFEQSLRAAADDGRLPKFCDWVRERFRFELTPDEAISMRRAELENEISAAVEDFYRPEMRRMERAVLLEVLDNAWKDHLLVMDHLKNSVGLRGYAQVDPKVEYKKEGMRTFENMWRSIAERITDLVFRIELIDDGYVGSTWNRAQTVRQETQSTVSQIAAQQQAAIEGTQTSGKIEPIRNRDQRVGRNDPCPCGSGKKFKVCCMRKSVGSG